MTTNKRCRDYFIDILLLIYDCFQIYCCNNHWRNLYCALWGRWHPYVFWWVNNNLKLAPAHLFKITVKAGIFMKDSISLTKKTKRNWYGSLTLWEAGQTENFETDSHEGPFTFLLTRKSSNALHMIVMVIITFFLAKKEFHWIFYFPQKEASNRSYP